MIRRTGIFIALVLAVFALALAGCSGDDSSASTTDVQSASAAGAAVAAAEPGISALEEAAQHGVEVTPHTGISEEQAPEFTGLTMWLNSPPLTMTELQGEVVLVDFWTYT